MKPFRPHHNHALIVLLLVAGLVLPNSAAAYVEPGMAAMLWQVILAAVLGGVMLFRKSQMFLKMIFTRLQRVVFGKKGE